MALLEWKEILSHLPEDIELQKYETYNDMVLDKGIACIRSPYFSEVYDNIYEALCSVSGIGINFIKEEKHTTDVVIHSNSFSEKVLKPTYPIPMIEYDEKKSEAMYFDGKFHILPEKQTIEDGKLHLYF